METKGRAAGMLVPAPAALVKGAAVAEEAPAAKGAAAAELGPRVEVPAGGVGP